MKRIAIVGAGPAGLAAAISAMKLGLAPEVFEQAPDFARIGGGILIHSNGLRAMDALGLLESFEPKLRFTQKLEVALADGRALSSFDLAEAPIPQNRGAVVMRYDLQEHLLDAARREGVEVKFAHRLTRLAAGRDSVAVGFENGAEASVEVVLACDGINSAARAAAGIEARLTTVGEAYLRGISGRARRDETIREIWGIDGRRFGICPLPAGRTYFFCSVPLGRWDAIRDSSLAEWIEGWSGFGAEVPAILRAAADWNRVAYDELREVRLARWYRERVFIVGDAAHAMTPNLGQGANSAIVDALVLTRLLAPALRENSDLGAVGREYEAIRKDFVSRIQDAARMMGRVAAFSSAPARIARNVLLRMLARIPSITHQTALLGCGYNPAEDRFFAPL